MLRHPQVNGLDLVRLAVGDRVQTIRRHVFRLGAGGEALDHGITEVHFSGRVLAFGIGPNDTGIVVAEGRVFPGALDPRDWTKVTADPTGRWRAYRSLTLDRVHVFGDDGFDLALVFHLEGGLRFSIVLCERCLSLGHELERFAQRRPQPPRLVGCLDERRDAGSARHDRRAVRAESTGRCGPSASAPRRRALT